MSRLGGFQASAELRKIARGRLEIEWLVGVVSDGDRGRAWCRIACGEVNQRGGWRELDFLPNDAFDREHHAGLCGIVGADAEGAVHITHHAGAVKGKRDAPLLAGWDFAGPICGGNATAGGEHVGDGQVGFTGVGEHKIVLDD